jgi:hypothetical protein
MVRNLPTDCAVIPVKPVIVETPAEKALTVAAEPV